MMKLQNLKYLQPRKFFNLGRHDLSHVGDTGKDYFVSLGCSFTYGVGLQYEDVWCNQLANKLQWEHVNLAWPGTSIEYQYDKLVKAEKLLENAKFIIWMQSPPIRSHRILASYIIGDRLARIPVKTLWEDIDSWNKIQKFFDLSKNKKVLYTNSWHWNNKIKLLLKNKICDKNSQYFYNDDEPYDWANDGLHPGKKSHSKLANDWHAHIIEHFANWL